LQSFSTCFLLNTISTLQCFLFSIFWCCHNGDHPQGDFVKILLYPGSSLWTMCRIIF
jgi:hypothetical protein